MVFYVAANSYEAKCRICREQMRAELRRSSNSHATLLNIRKMDALIIQYKKIVGMGTIFFHTLTSRLSVYLSGHTLRQELRHFGANQTRRQHLSIS